MLARMSFERRAVVVREISASSHAELATRAVAPALRPYLRELNGYCERRPGRVRRRELPRPGIVAILELGPPLRIAVGAAGRIAARAGGFVAGTGDTYLTTEHDGAQAGIELYLTPLGARLVLGAAPAELAGSVVDLADLLPHVERDLLGELRELASWDARFDRVEAFVAERTARGGARDAAIAAAVRRIELRAGLVQARVLARELGVSPKRLIALFRDQVGVPPKQLCRIVRFDRLMQHLRGGSTGRWADLARAFGYYDQAHLARDVGQFCGMSPTQLRATLLDFPALPTA